MKVYLSNYRDHWISPYTVLEKVLWWKDWTKIEYDTPWVERWADRINPVCKAIQKVLDVIHPRISYVKIDRWDTWNMETTLSTIILPMLKQLDVSKHGAPFVDDQDVPPHLTKAAGFPGEDPYDVDSNHFKRWDWVLGEMIWAFEQIQPDYDWESLYETGKPDYQFIKRDDGCSEMVPGPRHTYKVNREGMRVHQDRIDRGLQLFGKYYQALWD